MNGIGTYIYDNTFIHKLDPRIKLIINIAYISMTFVKLCHFIGPYLFYWFR